MADVGGDPVFQRWDDIPRKTVRPGVWRKVVSGERVMLVLNEASPGMRPNPHSHPHEQIVHLLRGRIRLHVGDRAADLEPGAVVVVPPETIHYSEVLGDEPALMLDAFSPIREEYL